eukprot:TRINITY_DN21043_c0_g1_i2.p1 TRINITY_DN21043_c0_g1~~TRINITY_DN21043_c0_g1_i2.p1  ORF type:complete len:1015 (-),score=108.32 TRINITY_DN21043_c0_g1_i2:523-3567(-)
MQTEPFVFRRWADWKKVFVIVLEPLVLMAPIARGQVLTLMGRRREAVKDLKQALGLEERSGSKSGAEQVQAHLHKLLEAEENGGDESRTEEVSDDDDSGSGSCRISKKHGEEGAELSTAWKGIDVTWSSDRGRGLQAQKDFAPGEVALSGRPYVAKLRKPSRRTCCHFCFHPLPLNPIPCHNCCTAIYCGELCREAAGSFGVSPTPHFRVSASSPSPTHCPSSRYPARESGGSRKENGAVPRALLETGKARSALDLPIRQESGSVTQRSSMCRTVTSPGVATFPRLSTEVAKDRERSHSHSNEAPHSRSSSNVMATTGNCLAKMAIEETRGLEDGKKNRPEGLDERTGEEGGDDLCKERTRSQERWSADGVSARWRGEHVHECGGASWAEVLPERAALAARLVVRQLLEEEANFMIEGRTTGTQDYDPARVSRPNSPGVKERCQEGELKRELPASSHGVTSVTVAQSKAKEENKWSAERSEQEGEEGEHEPNLEARGGLPRCSSGAEGREGGEACDRAILRCTEGAHELKLEARGSLQRGSGEAEEPEQDELRRGEVFVTPGIDDLSSCTGNMGVMECNTTRTAATGSHNCGSQWRQMSEHRKVKTLVHGVERLSHDEKLDLISLSVVVAHCLRKSGKRISVLSTAKESRGEGANQDIQRVQQALLVFALRKVTVWHVVRALGILNWNSMVVKESLLEEGPPSNDVAPLDWSRDDRTVAFKPEEGVAIALYSDASLFNHSCRPNAFVSFRGRHLVVRTTQPLMAGGELFICYGPQKGQDTFWERQSQLSCSWGFTCHCSACQQGGQFADVALRGYRCPSRGCTGVIPGCDFEKTDGAGECHKWVDEVPKRDSGEKEVLVTAKTRRILSGACCRCGTRVCVEEFSSREAAAVENLESTTSGIFRNSAPLRIPRAMESVRAILHPYNKRLAQLEDSAARALCELGSFHEALGYARESFKILAFHYPHESIVLAHERLKLATVLRAAGKTGEAEEERRKADSVLKAHYGTAEQVLMA